MKLESLENLFIHELKHLLSAEKQLAKALPKMAKGANSEALRAGIEEHLEQTKGHVERLEKIFGLLGKTAPAETCKAMEGLIEEGSDLLKEEGSPSVKDAALIGAAQRWSTMRSLPMGPCELWPNYLDRTKARNSCRKPWMRKGRPTRS